MPNETPRIIIELPADRTHPGTIRVEDSFGNVLAGPFPALGRSGNNLANAALNPTHDHTRQNGDTPIGSWDAVGLLPNGPGTSRPVESDGSAGSINMIPRSGEAYTAAQNGRSYIYVHDGHTLANGSLMPTAGCVRVYDADLAVIIQTIVTNGGFPVRSDSVPTISIIPEVTNRCQANSIFDYPDPPPLALPQPTAGQPPPGSPGPPVAA